MSFGKSIGYSIIAAVLTYAGYLTIGEGTGAISYPCVKTVTVVDILSIEYRSGVVLGDDGEEYKWGGHVADGDEICVKTERRIDWSFSD